MTVPAHGRSADALLDLNGQVFVVDPNGDYWVRFAVHRVAPSPERPHGLDYSLSLHGPTGERLVGFDNAHSARGARGPGGRAKGPCDHRHRLGAVRPYRFRDPATLVGDFRAEVDRFLKEKGVV